MSIAHVQYVREATGHRCVFHEASNENQEISGVLRQRYAWETCNRYLPEPARNSNKLNRRLQAKVQKSDPQQLNSTAQH